MLKENKTVLMAKHEESLTSVLPIAGIVFLLCFTIVPVPNSIMIGVCSWCCNADYWYEPF